MEILKFNAQIEILEKAARGYLMMADVMKKAGYEYSMQMYFRKEIECFNKIIEIEEIIRELECSMAA